MRKVQKVCNECEKPYFIDIDRAANSKYCSPECKDIVSKRYYKETHVSKRTGKGSLIKKCTWCSAQFEVLENLRGKGHFEKCPSCRNKDKKLTRKCDRCAKEIPNIKEGKKGRQRAVRYCEECQVFLHLYLLENNVTYDQHKYKFCKKCKEIFCDLSKGHGAKFKCLACSNNETVSVIFEVKECPICEESFKQSFSKQVHCSIDCVKKHFKQEKIKRLTKKCKGCNQDFYDNSFEEDMIVCQRCKALQEIASHG
jgi:hypothetical protein